MSLPAEPQKIITPQRIAAAERLEAVRKLKAEGLSQAEVCRHLELPRSTVGACGTLTIKSPHRLKATEARVSLINKPNFWPFLRCFPVSIAPRWAVWQG